MNTNRIIFRRLTAVLIIALLLQFALITTPSASAQGGATATPTPSLPDRISCYGGTTGVQCLENTNNHIRMEMNQASGGGNGDVHLRFLLLPANAPRNIYVRVYAEHQENSTHSQNRVSDTLVIRRNDGHDELYNQPQWLYSGQGLAVSDSDTFETTFYANNGPMPPLYYDVRVYGQTDWPLTSGNLFVRLEVWTDAVTLPTPTPTPGYDCGGTDLSSIAQAVLAVLAEVGPQEYCENLYDDGLIAIPPGQDAFERFQNLAETAIGSGPHEIDFATMIWDADENPDDGTPSNVDSPGDFFLQGIQALYDDVNQNPENYPGGVRVRILLGLKYYFGTSYQDQRVIVMNDLEDMGIEREDTNWSVEVAAYRNAHQQILPFPPDASGIHSHVKMMLVDGKHVIVSGHNMQYGYLADNPTHDMGVQVSGPIAQQSLQVFDTLWSKAYRCDLHDSSKCVSESITESIEDGIPHDETIKMIVPAGNDVVFSLFRDDIDKTADEVIVAAIEAANSKVNIIQFQLENFSFFNPPQYARAILNVLQKGNGQVNVNLLVSDGPENLLMSVPGICMLKTKLILEDPFGTHNLNANISDHPIHTKALSIDGDFIIVGSQNFNSSAWGDDEENDGLFQFDLAEYSLGVDSKDAADDFDAAFATESVNARPISCFSLIYPGTLPIFPPPLLQPIIDEASPGSAIYIPAGVYTESVTINKPLTLVGAGGNQAIFQPEGSQPAFRITSSDVTIANMKISGGDGYGIELIDSSPSSLRNIQINRVVFENNAQGGILAQGLISGSPMNYTIENNTFIGGADGIAINMVETQADTSFIRNNIFSGQTNAPVHILSTKDRRVEYSYNLFDDCGLGACSTNWIQGNMSAFSGEHDNLFDLDPLFASPENGAYQLSTGSPAIDAGDPSLLHEFFFDGDNDGFIRIDMGAFEYAPNEENLAPVVDAGVDQDVEFGTPVTINATYTDADNTENHSARVDWGDGVVEDVPVTMTGPGAGEVASEHTYSNAGEYTIEVCVTDLYGAVGCDMVSITVTVTEPVDLYLHGIGSTANPPTLYLDSIAPGNTSAKYKDSSAVNFNNGNGWKEVGTWPAESVSEGVSLSELDDLHVWLGLKNSDDTGTRFDLRAEVYKNGELITSGETLCITGLVRNANQAQEVSVAFDTFDPTVLNSGDVLSLEVWTRIGTDGAGNLCGGHSNAVGLRLYFDSLTRQSRFGFR